MSSLLGFTVEFLAISNDAWCHFHQRGVGQMVFLHRSTDTQLCMVQALTRWKQLLEDRRGPLFQHENGLPLTQYQFQVIIWCSLLAAGFLDWLYGTHSFHIGAASTAAGLNLYRVTAFGALEVHGISFLCLLVMGLFVFAYLQGAA